MTIMAVAQLRPKDILQALISAKAEPECFVLVKSATAVCRLQKAVKKIQLSPFVLRLVAFIDHVPQIQSRVQVFRVAISFQQWNGIGAIATRAGPAG